MSDQDARSKNFAFNYQSDIFNQKAPVKAEYNYSHKGFQPNSSNKSSFNFLSWEDNKSNNAKSSLNQNVNHIKRNQNKEPPKPKLHQNFEEKLYGKEPVQNIENYRGQKETLFLGNYEGDEYKIKREKNNEYNPNLYYKTKKPDQVKKEQTFGASNTKAKPAIQRGKIDEKKEEKINKVKYTENGHKKLESLNIERSTNNEYNPKYDPKQNRVNMLKSNIFNDKNIEEMNNKEDNKMKDLKEENKSSKREFVDKKDNFGKKSKFDKNAEKLPNNLDWRDTKTNLLFSGETNKEIMKKDARQRKFKELYGSEPAIKKERIENNFKINDRNLIEKTTKEINPDLNEAKIKKISENISQIQGNQFLNDSSKYKIKNENDENNIKLYEISSKNLSSKEIERAFAQKGIKIYDVKEDSNAIFGANKNNKITFKIRDNEYDKDFNSKIKNIQKEFFKDKKAEIKVLSQQEKNKGDLIPNSVQWNSSNINSITKNKNVDKTLQEKTHSKPVESKNNEQKMTQIFVNLKYKNETNII